jgi:hypothetical protein
MVMHYINASTQQVALIYCSMDEEEEEEKRTAQHCEDAFTAEGSSAGGTLPDDDFSVSTTDSVRKSVHFVTDENDEILSEEHEDPCCLSLEQRRDLLWYTPLDLAIFRQRAKKETRLSEQTEFPAHCRTLYDGVMDRGELMDEAVASISDSEYRGLERFVLGRDLKRDRQAASHGVLATQAVLRRNMGCECLQDVLAASSNCISVKSSQRARLAAIGDALVARLYA